MFKVLVHDEFYESGDSAQELDSFETLASAWGYYQAVCRSEPASVYDDGVELVLDTDDERVTLDYFAYSK